MKAFLLVALIALAVGCLDEIETSKQPYSTQRSRLLQDKTGCATAGVSLSTYSQQYSSASEASGKIKVEYRGKKLNCWQNNKMEEIDSTCKIGKKNPEEGCIKIMVNTTRCVLKDTNC